ncbi:hypothetical protein [Bifidobacterium sp. ESL0745]|uniref:hypothetical protein n=1 Tax=Bifidobacterium sp. ESL0745 TaxID=2983226 RepID=UPI0023F77BF9|nr:hypothetical protein [Bifidobacterium sp. ESL0745]MDF7665745.1 hypothetical protein [Bifidobacterium sp. ESL0745]
MNRLKVFARKHRLVLPVTGVILALILLGAVIGITVVAALEADGLAEWAALIWLLATA